MKNDTIKYILLEAFRAAEKTIEADINQDENEKRMTQYLFDLFKYMGLGIIEKITLQGKAYIQHQVKEGIHKTTVIAAKTISSLVSLIIGFLIVCIGLVFGAVALSLWLGKLVDSEALGFLISGALWVVVAFSLTKILFSKKRLETIISKKINF